MAEHLLGNVYQVGGGDITHPLDGASYLVVDTEKQEHALIDCGSPLGYEALSRQLDELNITLGSIAVVYGTHGHNDHIAAKKYIPNAKLYLHANDTDAVLAADYDRTAMFLYDGQTFPKISHVDIITEGYEAVIGRTVLRALHTPGHTRGSVTYQLTTKEGIFGVTGDALWGGFHPRMGSDLDDWETSLDKLAKEKFDYLSFGHGVSWPVPNAMKHIDLARSCFRRKLTPSHGGRLYNPWSEPEA